MTNTQSRRIDFIDVSRIIGISLMYYGHSIESMMKLGNEAAALQYKFIYSFHMPLFFILSGYLASVSMGDKTLPRFIKDQALSRLIPYVCFVTLLIIPTFFFPSNSVGVDLSTFSGYLKGIMASFIGGFPVFNIPLWFLICIFLVEVFHYLGKVYLLKKIPILLVCLLFYTTGSLLAWYATWLNPLKILSPNSFIFPNGMLLEAFIGYSFYLFGLHLKTINFFSHFQTKTRQFLLAVAATAVVFYTFDLNKGMFLLSNFDAVIMVGSSHGNPILFPITAISGSLGVIALGLLMRNSKALQYLGAKTLVIFALNGVFYHFVNDPIAKVIEPLKLEENLYIFCYGIIISVISIGITIPFMIALNRLTPQLVGKKGKDLSFNTNLKNRTI